MNSFRTSTEVILDFCKQEMSTHTDVEEFAKKLVDYLENRHGEH
jgi:hypothetical protein